MVFWTGHDPQGRRWDLADPVSRRVLYEIVLVDVRLKEIVELLNGPELLRIWDELFLPRIVRETWAPLIAAARES